MPRHIRFIGRYGNGLAVLVYGIVFLILLEKGGQPAPIFLVLALPVALGIFNMRVLRKAAFLLSEEEWLKGEVRKAELRRKLAELHGESSSSGSGVGPGVAPGGGPGGT